MLLVHSIPPLCLPSEALGSDNHTAADHSDKASGLYLEASGLAIDQTIHYQGHFVVLPR
jgi:hypothetical protein